ncbi:hypothetical protein HY488_00695 [Candidatus Woesearchaeota archaeon]|nr:hypothetical protein [Candidatus Woesearchaeota archaeon]
MANEGLPFGAPPTQPEEKKHAGLFGGKHDEAAGVSVSDLSMQLNNLSRRLRILEERYTSLRKKTQDTDQTILNVNKQLTSELKATHSELVDFRREFYDLRDKTKLIVKELKECAKTDEVKVLENYINLWEPVNFVTKAMVEKIVDDRIEEKLGQRPLLREG